MPRNDLLSLGTLKLEDLCLRPCALFRVLLKVAFIISVPSVPPVLLYLCNALVLQFSFDRGSRVEIQNEIGRSRESRVSGSRSCANDPRRQSQSKYNGEKDGPGSTLGPAERSGKQEKHWKQPESEIYRYRPHICGTAEHDGGQHQLCIGWLTIEAH